MSKQRRLNRSSFVPVTIVAVVLLNPFAFAQDDTYQGPGAIADPGTYAGSRQMQEQEQQQDQQYRDQQQQQFDQELQEQQQQRGQDDQYQSYYARQPGNEAGQAASVRGKYGAIYISPTDPSISGYSYDFSNIHSGRAEAMAECYRRAGVACKPALVFNNACAVLAVGARRVWAAKSASSPALAADMATTACRAAGGGKCRVVDSYCSL